VRRGHVLRIRRGPPVRPRLPALCPGHLLGELDALAGFNRTVACVRAAERLLPGRHLLRLAQHCHVGPRLHDLHYWHLRAGAQYVDLCDERLDRLRAAGGHVRARDILLRAKHALCRPRLLALCAWHLFVREHAVALRVWRDPAHGLRAAVGHLRRGYVLCGGVLNDGGPRLRAVPRRPGLHQPYIVSVRHAGCVRLQWRVSGEEMGPQRWGKLVTKTVDETLTKK
jgi:hypothetical protein